ncbi:hypothetical protein GCM10022221_22790 [Actinocorallia aurea]
MGLRTFFNTLGAKAPHVETVLDRTALRPGEPVGATVTLQGGGADVRVEALAIELVIRVGALEQDGGELAWKRPEPVASFELPAFTLAAGETLVRRVECAVPWEMPLTHADGRRLRGTRAAFRTTLKIDTAIDRGDFDEIAVHALPAQDALLQALTTLGFRLGESAVKQGNLRGDATRSLPFWQEIEAFFPSAYRRSPGDRLPLVFAARPDSLALILGTFGPYPLDPALDAAAAATWLTSHLDAHWRR